MMESLEKELRDLEEDLANKEYIANDYRRRGLEPPSPLLESIRMKREYLELRRKSAEFEREEREPKHTEYKEEKVSAPKPIDDQAQADIDTIRRFLESLKMAGLEPPATLYESLGNLERRILANEEERQVERRKTRLEKLNPDTTSLEVRKKVTEPRDELEDRLPIDLVEMMKVISEGEQSYKAPYVSEIMSKMERYGELEGTQLSAKEIHMFKYLLFKADKIIEFDTIEYGADEIVLVRKGVHYNKNVDLAIELCPRVVDFIKRLGDDFIDRHHLNSSSLKMYQGRWR